MLVCARECTSVSYCYGVCSLRHSGVHSELIWLLTFAHYHTSDCRWQHITRKLMSQSVSFLSYYTPEHGGVERAKRAQTG
uniref:Uncharacterized protein n=1 Tax=Anguilla anguilla TaxID=7936 RepID=A0A0E9WXU6_ANGAN